MERKREGEWKRERVWNERERKGERERAKESVLYEMVYNGIMHVHNKYNWFGLNIFY